MYGEKLKIQINLVTSVPNVFTVEVVFMTAAWCVDVLIFEVSSFPKKWIFLKMGRKIPGRKHHGVRDPEKQRAERFKKWVIENWNR